MDDKKIEGTAGPALAAHSKDASAPSSNPASSRTGSPSTGSPSTGSPIDGIAGTVGKLASQAREAASKASSSLSDMVDQAREQLADHGVTTDQAADFVREKPLMALLAAGSAGLLLGMLLARRSA